jgi:WD40 repeat protein
VKLSVAAIVIMAAGACTSPASQGGATISPTQVIRASGERRAPEPPTFSTPASGARTPEPFRTVLHCEQGPIPGHPLALFHNYDPNSPLGVLDVANPTHPVLDCYVSPAQGGRFLSSTKIAFWSGDWLGTVDFGTGVITETAHLPAVVGSGAFSPDGSAFAYQAFDDAGGVTGHIFSSGVDRVLYKQQPVGGHGGPGSSAGPFDQVVFSADGTEILDYMLFRPVSGPPNLMVFTRDGAVVLQLAGSIGVWGSSGHSLYFTVPNPAGPTNELDQLDSAGQRHAVTKSLRGIGWPALAPDGSSIVFNTWDNSVPDCGGVPHLWTLDLQIGEATQISKTQSSTPVFVGPTTVWSDEEQLIQCGPGGPSVNDGVLLAHDLTTGAESRVDLGFYSQLAGPNMPTFATTAWVIDTTF